MKFSWILLVMLGIFQAGLLTGAIEEKPIVVIIPSYNNERWVEPNLSSVFMQQYENYRVMYIDDCSSDKTYERALQLVMGNGQENRCTIIHNDERCNAMANWYKAIHSCDDDEIVVMLDGDDFFAHDQVLARINEAYSNPDIWFTYGEYKYYPADQIGDVNKTFPQGVIDSNGFRQWWWLPVSHLRTHYAWLFKLVKLEDFLYEDYFYAMTCDKAMLAPIIEMASRGHFLQIHDVLYMYNNTNPINDGVVNVGLQTSLRDYILSKKPYQPLDAPKSVEFFDQRDRVSPIVLCAGNPNCMNIDSMIKKLGNLDEVYVLAPADSVDCDFEETVNYVVYEQNGLVQQLRECIEAIDSRYVLLGSDLDDVMNDIDFTIALKLLKKTHTDLFYSS